MLSSWKTWCVVHHSANSFTSDRDHVVIRGLSNFFCRVVIFGSPMASVVPPPGDQSCPDHVVLMVNQTFSVFLVVPLGSQNMALLWLVQLFHAVRSPLPRESLLQCVLVLMLLLREDERWLVRFLLCRIPWRSFPQDFPRAKLQGCWHSCPMRSSGVWLGYLDRLKIAGEDVLHKPLTCLGAPRHSTSCIGAYAIVVT